MIKQIYIYFLSFPPSPEAAWTAGFQAVETVSGEAWNFPVDTSWQQKAEYPGSQGRGLPVPQGPLATRSPLRVARGLQVFVEPDHQFLTAFQEPGVPISHRTITETLTPQIHFPSKQCPGCNKERQSCSLGNHWLIYAVTGTLELTMRFCMLTCHRRALQSSGKIPYQTLPGNRDFHRSEYGRQLTIGHSKSQT